VEKSIEKLIELTGKVDQFVSWANGWVAEFREIVKDSGNFPLTDPVKYRHITRLINLYLIIQAAAGDVMKELAELKNREDV